MKIIKKIMCGMSLVMIGGTCLLQTVSAAWPVLNPPNPYINAQDSGSAEAVAVVGAADAWATDWWQEDALVNVIKWWINWVLGILALIALIVLLWGGFLMVTAAGNEDRYSKWWTILKQAAIGLLLIGIAWFIISIIFWLVNLTATGVGAADTQN